MTSLTESSLSRAEPLMFLCYDGKTSKGHLMKNLWDALKQSCENVSCILEFAQYKYMVQKHPTCGQLKESQNLLKLHIGHSVDKSPMHTQY